VKRESTQYHWSHLIRVVTACTVLDHGYFVCKLYDQDLRRFQIINVDGHVAKHKPWVVFCPTSVESDIISSLSTKQDNVQTEHGRSLQLQFLQRGRIACNAERCNSYGNSVRPSVCLSHASTLSRRMKIGSRERFQIWRAAGVCQVTVYYHRCRHHQFVELVYFILKPCAYEFFISAKTRIFS